MDQTANIMLSFAEKQLVSLGSVHWQGQHLYVPEIDRDPSRRQVLVWKKPAKPSNDVLAKACFEVERVPGGYGNRIRLRSRFHAGQYLYVPEIDHDRERREVLVWTGTSVVSDSLLSKATFEVEPVAGNPHQFRLRSYHWQGQYLYVPAIDYNADRRQVFVWKGALGDDLLSKATFSLCGGTERAVVRRDGAGCTGTMLRKVATRSREGDVWISSRACVQDEESVTVLRREGEFAWVLSASGAEGFVKASYLYAPPEVVTMFHGTDGKHAASIIEHGLQPSKDGRLGPGVYLTPYKDVAGTIARYRGLQFVVECEVTVGRVFSFNAGTLEGGGLPKHSKVRNHGRVCHLDAHHCISYG
jgi:hypothetical protein